MSSAPLVRWSGAALAIAGGLYAVASPFHPDDTDPNGLLSPLWGAVHVSHLTTFSLAMFGLIGLYLRLAPRAPRLGLAALFLGQVGSALTVGGILLEAFVLPVIASQTPGAPRSLAAFLNLSGPYRAWSGVLPVILVSLLLWAAGYILFGIATARSGILPRAAGVLLVAGTALSLAPLLPVKVAGNEATAIAFLWLGCLLWARAAAPAARPAAANGAA